MKKYLGKLQERNGEFEYQHNILFETNSSPEKWIENYASTFYPGGDGEEVEDALFAFFGGQVLVFVDSVVEVTDEEYAVLQKYMI